MLANSPAQYLNTRAVKCVLNVYTSKTQAKKRFGFPGGRTVRWRKDPLDLPEDDLLALFEKGIQQNVFTPSFLQSLKSLLNRVVPTS